MILDLVKSAKFETSISAKQYVYRNNAANTANPLTMSKWVSVVLDNLI
jgi:hypothetical protein